MPETRLVAVARVTGHRFADPALLLQGLTHASTCDAQAPAAERLAAANERLEFLGDALLAGAVALGLYQRHPEAAEGALSRLKSRLVSRRALAAAMARSGLLGHCRVATSLQRPWPDSVRANLAEGLLAAIFLDGGWSALVTAVERLLGDELDASDAGEDADAKNQLQALCLERFRELPVYHTRRAGGSDHAPEFVSQVQIADHLADGHGGSRREAERRAAAALKERLEAMA